MIVTIRHNIFKDRISGAWKCMCHRFRVDGTGYSMIVMESNSWESLLAPLNIHLLVCGHVQ